ncbi:2-phosphosulfolactate phosphatase [Cytobacillus depressus]|uniref:Probable 2-phosphosulfolactate phosphatase n=1 Tax=Cytobacillus depressus TaxID=1602942 RepID=A0A6L3VA48_9BACI|nr:2-phosphosulfolactate phosphatase [Cytobacillus depressus]KAB2336237.1 2-phosphosulfolactate phosphatase [Cytobacillus depressus]
MGKIHLLFKKEEIDEEKMKNHVAVVFDVLLATSTITAGLHFGAKEVIPVRQGEEALKVAKGRNEDSFLLVGEYKGKTIDGFHAPQPLPLRDEVRGKSIILSTTNGTVAVRKASTATQVYIGSLLNGQAVAERILEKHREETIILICSGTDGSFCIEDFYGAGYLLDCLSEGGQQVWELTDAAQAALLFYQANRNRSEEILQTSRVGQRILGRGAETELSFVAQCGVLSIIPYFDGKSIQVS